MRTCRVCGAEFSHRERLCPHDGSVLVTGAKWEVEYEGFRKSDLIGSTILMLIVSIILFKLGKVGWLGAGIFFVAGSVLMTLLVWKGRTIEY